MVAPNTAADASHSERPVFYLPDLGEGLEEAELIEWCVQVGQCVEENDILAKMETAKALVEVPSPRGGVIAILHGTAGQAVKVGSPLVTFEAVKGETKSEALNAAPAAAQRPAEEAEQAEQREDAGTVVGFMPVDHSNRGGKALAAPSVRRLAREMGVDLERVRGTGIGGRITAGDVKEAAQNSGGDGEADAGRDAPCHEPAVHAAAHAAVHAAALPIEAGAVRIPFRGVRKAIADHLRKSVSHAVHFTVTEEADVTALDALRRRLMAASNETVTLLPFVAAAVCRVLVGHPRSSAFGRLNSTVDDRRQEIVQHPIVHLGIATDTETGLMVPVIRDAQRLGVLELARRIAQLAQEARRRTLTPEQLTGSTFTISNFGPMGGRFATPIINYPECGILAIGRARDGVVVRDGMIGVGKLLPLSLAADHRVIDGGAAAGALARIVELLQSPDQLLPPGRAG